MSEGQVHHIGERSLKDMRATLSDGQRKIVQTVLGHIERELIDTLPELNAGVKTSAASGSFSVTLQVKHQKRGRFVASVGARIRTPREKLELDMHLAEDGQLSLGLPDGWDEAEEGDGE